MSHSIDFNRMRILIIFMFSLICTPAFADSLFELKVGRRWTYEVEGGSQSLATSEILDSISVANQTWFKLQEYGSIYWIRNSEAGQVEASHSDQELDLSSEITEQVVFKYPVQVGDQ